MLVDAGDGVVSQLLAAGIALESITQIALTHMHWDHILGYPALIWGSWNMGRLALTVTGPVGTRNMHDQLVERYYREQAEWAMELGFPVPASTTFWSATSPSAGPRRSTDASCRPGPCCTRQWMPSPIDSPTPAEASS